MVQAASSARRLVWPQATPAFFVQLDQDPAFSPTSRPCISSYNQLHRHGTLRPSSWRYCSAQVDSCDPRASRLSWLSVSRMSFGLSASDCVALPSFAWQVYKTCRDSSSDYAELSSEVASLHAVLCEVNALVGQYSLSDESIKRVGLVLKGCRDVLKSIEKQLARYKSLGTDKTRMRDRTRWAMETVGDARIRLLSHTAMPSLLLSSLVG